jgi:hypothetical protein
MAKSRFLATEARPRALQAEEMLLLAVLEQAVADLDHPCPAVRADADAYIFSYGSDYSMFSFDSVCSYFKLSSAAVREALLRERQGRRRHAPAPVFKRAA